MLLEDLWFKSVAVRLDHIWRCFMTDYFNCFCLCSSLLSSKSCFPLTKFKDLLVLWFWSTQAVPWCAWGLDPKPFQNGRCKWEKDSGESFSGDVLKQRGGASHTSLVCTCKGMDNIFTHSTCRCLRAQGIPWERKQTLLHWVLHCYKEITAKAFSFKMPISNVMFYRKKSDFFFSSFIFHQGFLSVCVHSSRFLSLSCGLRLPPEILFLWRAAQVWKGKSVLSAKKKNIRGRDRGRSGHTVTHV